MESFDTIKNIKEKIKSKERINENEYKLLFEHKILEDKKTLEDYNINNKSIIYLKYYNNFQIFIKSWYNKSFILDANGSVTIEIIKEKLKDKEGILPNQYKLVVDGKQLEEFKSLEDFNITEYSSIYLIKYELITIFVKTWVGTTFTLKIAETDKILDIKKYIEHKIGICNYEQRLTFEGKPLEDNKILGQYGIQGSSSLNLIFHLTLRLRGGH